MVESIREGGRVRALVRHTGQVEHAAVAVDGARGVKMAVLVGRGDGAPHFSMRHFQVEPGGHTPRHAHDYEHEVYVLAGEGTVVLGTTTERIAAGDVVAVPAGLEHQFRVAADAGRSLEFLCLVPVERDGGGVTPGS